LQSQILRYSFSPKDDRTILLFAIVLFSLPFGSKITNHLLGVILIHSVIFAGGKELLHVFKSKFFWAFASFFLLYALSLNWTSNMGHGMSQLETKFGFFVLPLLVFWNKASIQIKENRTFLLQSFVMGNMVCLIAALMIASRNALLLDSWYYLNHNGVEIPLFTYVKFSEPFMHPGYLATHFGLAILILLFSMIHRGFRIGKILSITILLIGMLLLQGRINLIALIAVIGILSIHKSIQLNKKKWLVLPAIPVFFFFLLLAFGSEKIKERYLQFPDFSYDISGTDFNSATYRLAEWSCALDVIKVNPILGTGIGDNNTELWEQYQRRGFHVGFERKFNAHNQYLETNLSIGLVGLIVLLILLGTLFIRGIENKNELLIYSLLFFSFCLVTESMFERAWANILFALIFPILSLPSIQKYTPSKIEDKNASSL